MIRAAEPTVAAACPAPLTRASDGTERPRLAWAVMLVQAACGLLATLGLGVFTLGFAPSPGMVLLTLFNLGKNALLLVLAVGVVRGCAPARRAALVVEGATALAGMASIAVSVVPGVDTGAGLATLLLSVGLPSVAVALLASPAEQATARQCPRMCRVLPSDAAPLMAGRGRPFTAQPAGEVRR